MKLPGKANADHPMSQLAFHQDKASENSPNDDPDNQASNGNKGDGHGDTTSNREPSDRENSRHRSSYDLGSVTDLILRLNPNRPNLLYLTRRPFHSVSTGVENERQPRVAGSGLKGVPVKAVVLCTLSGQRSLLILISPLAKALSPNEKVFQDFPVMRGRKWLVANLTIEQSI
jgi:hypothetical protein